MRRRPSLSATLTSAASARSIGRSRYCHISSRIRGQSSSTSSANISPPASIMSHNERWSLGSYRKRCIASVNAGHTVTSGSRMVSSAAAHRRWYESVRSMIATSGPASTSTFGMPYFLQKTGELLARALRQLHPAAVARTDDMRQPNREWRTRSSFFLFAQGSQRLAHYLGLGKAALVRDPVDQSRGLGIDSDIQRSHGTLVSQAVIQGYAASFDL